MMTNDVREKRKLVVFSLTDEGQALGHRLQDHWPALTHLHKPTHFIQTVQDTFASGAACLFICATGIVVRALAPVLTDKRQDPPVVVLDEAGEFVIPLLSGHEGGAGALAFKVASALGARCVVTSHTDYSRPVYTLGMGCDRGCPLSELKSLLKTIETTLDDSIVFSALASIELKRDEASLVQLSHELNVPFVVFGAERLRDFEQQLSVRSPIVFREVGCYGVAEAAALCAATQATGQPAELVVPKHKNRRATIAVARSYIPRPT